MNPNDLSRPHVFEKRGAKTLLLLHGTGGDEHDLLSLGKLIDPEANLLSPRGLWVEHGMNRFFERYPDGSFNEESVISAVEELRNFLIAALAEYVLDADQVFAVGFSNGANTAAALIALHPELLAGAALFGTTRPLKSIPRVPNLSGKRIWIANGENDSYAPGDVVRGWIDDLAAYGADVKLLSHPGGHQISPAHVQEIRRDLA